MFQLGKTIVSEELIESDFVCNLSACKGDCCVHGDAGAPLNEEETRILDEIFPKLKPYLRKEGIEAINRQGTYITKPTGELETPLVDNAECAYVVFDDKGIALCGIEETYNKGEIDFQKPISCHLYPVRVKDYSSFSALNYHRWQVCSPACSLGKELKVPIYKFVKDALIRRFGKDWYADLEKIAENIKR